MSSSPILPGGGKAQQGIADVVGQDDLTRFAQIAGVLRYLAAPLEPTPPPTKAIPLAADSADAIYKNLKALMVKEGVPGWIADIWAGFWSVIIAGFGVFFIQVVSHLAPVLAPAGIILLEALGAVRAGIDPSVGLLAQEVLTEFLGVEVSTADLPLGIGGKDHVARAKALGGLLTGQLESELSGDYQSGRGSLAPMSTFSGFAVNFGLASGIMGVIGGMVPGGWHLNELRELGEEVATNIGLGRLVRQALRELVRVLVQMPAQWYFNTKYLPTQFKETELVNPYAQVALDRPHLYQAMHLLGYSDDKIAAFLKMHEKRLTPADVALLVNHAVWAAPDAEKYLAQAGWPEGSTGTLFALEDLREQQKWYDKLVSELEDEVKNGRITVEEFESLLRGTGVTSTIGGAGPGGTVLPTLNGLPFSDAVKDVIIATVKFKAAARVKQRPHLLTPGELFYGFAAGLQTASALRDRWTAEGVPQADQDVRLQLWLLRLNRLEELQKERQAHYEAQVRRYGEVVAGAKKPGPVPPAPPVAPFPIG